jgi:beta-lactamase class A
LNSATPGDERDTTTPDAMLADMDALLLGSQLTAPLRDQLVTWLKGCKTGAEKLRAGMPRSWTIGDKTGMGGRGSTNDVAIAWPVQRPPILIAAYLTDTDASEAARNNALAEVGQLVSRWAVGA